MLISLEMVPPLAGHCKIVEVVRGGGLHRAGSKLRIDEVSSVMGGARYARNKK
jgi:hypothetical protein